MQRLTFQPVRSGEKCTDFLVPFAGMVCFGLLCSVSFCAIVTVWSVFDDHIVWNLVTSEVITKSIGMESLSLEH